MNPAWKKILSNLQKKDEFVVEQIYKDLPENSSLFREFCYVTGETFQVYIHQNALEDIYKHALDGLKNGKEVAGVLVGRHLLDMKRNVEFVEILSVVQVQSNKSTSVDVDIPVKEWSRIQVHIEDSTNYKIVGWYHSHPRMRAFMSTVDQSTQRNHFSHNGQVAIVVGVGSISEVKCFDHNSNEVSLYFFPQENDKQLIKANLEFPQKPSPKFFSQKSIKPIKHNIASLNKVFDHVFRKYELDRNFNLLGFDNPKGHIQGFDRLYPELRLGIEYYVGLEGDDALVLRAFEGEFMFFAINVNELDAKKIIDVVQVVYTSIFEYTKNYNAIYKDLYRDILGEFDAILGQLRG